MLTKSISSIEIRPAGDYDHYDGRYNVNVGRGEYYIR